MLRLSRYNKENLLPVRPMRNDEIGWSSKEMKGDGGVYK